MEPFAHPCHHSKRRPCVKAQYYNLHELPPSHPMHKMKLSSNCFSQHNTIHRLCMLEKFRGVQPALTSMRSTASCSAGSAAPSAVLMPSTMPMTALPQTLSRLNAPAAPVLLLADLLLLDAAPSVPADGAGEGTWVGGGAAVGAQGLRLSRLKLAVLRDAVAVEAAASDWGVDAVAAMLKLPLESARSLTRRNRRIAWVSALHPQQA